MAVSSISLSPSGDLHLLMGTAGIKMICTAWDGANLVDVTATMLATLTTDKAGVIQVTDTTINPVAPGFCLGVMSFVDGANTHYLLLRVSVHNSLSSVWFGNNQVTIPTTDVCTLTVYAQFDDGSWGDITQHQYLTFTSDNPTKVDVSMQGIAAGFAVGSSNIVVTAPGGKTSSVKVTVQDAIKNNQIVERIWGSGPTSDRRNLLILADGFAAADEPAFHRWKMEITKRLFQSKSHSPFNLLKNSWNVWSAFEASPESGITVASPIKVPDAHGFSAEYDFTKPDANGPRYLQAKDSRFGVMFGGRPGDRGSMIRSTPPLPQEWNNSWRPYRVLAHDPRRWTVLQSSYYASLKNKNAAQGSPEYDVGNTWNAFISEIFASPSGAAQSGNVVTITTTSPHGLSIGAKIRIWGVNENRYEGLHIIESVPSATTFTYSLPITGLPFSGGGWVGGADTGLVAILVNEDREGGTTDSVVHVSLGRSQGFHTHPRAQGGLDHDPNPDVLVDALAAVFTHELGHALDLGDEYEGYDDANHHTTLPSGDTEVEHFGNLTDFDTVKVGTAVNPVFIKWNWDRMVQSSRITEDFAVTIGSPFDLVLKAGEGSKWTKAQASGTGVYLRKRVIEQSAPDPTTLREGPLKITQINGDTVTVQGVMRGMSFRQGSVLYIPKTDKSGNIQTLIPSQVSDYIQANGAFPRADNNCANYTNNSQDPPSISGFHMPKHHRDLVGLYTGGGTWNCNAYRPCGYCKMRVEYYWASHWNWWPPGHSQVLTLVDFCFVCKYFLVDLIDGGQLSVLEKEYPEDC